MTLPQTIDAVLRFHFHQLGITEGWQLEERRGVIRIVGWDVPGQAQPSDQLLIDESNDVPGTEVGGLLFSQWYAVNGSDPVATAQREAADLVDGNTNPLSIRERAMIDLHNQRINYLTNRVIQLGNALAAMMTTAGNAAAGRDAAIAAAAVPFPPDQSAEAAAHFAATTTRKPRKAVNDYRDSINAGSHNNPVPPDV